MGTTRTVSVGLSAELVARAEEWARESHITLSEIIQQALLSYGQDRWRGEMNAFGQERARDLAATENDIVPAIRSRRTQGLQNGS